MLTESEKARMTKLVWILGTLAYGTPPNLEHLLLRDWRKRHQMEGKGLRSAFCDLSMARALYVRRDGLLLRYYLSQYNNGSEKDTTYFPKWHLSIILPPRRHSLPKECWGDTVKDVMQIAGPWWDDLRREIPKLEVA